uniref:Uncharacterized protein n=1 Tax=Utricularia reniformis TaxID=192314 RepID=A0A1Y0B2L1_9LAMI|nr:hypothetical protein AEK19_MT1435 [Utricularia reniformis]ART31628.1 hypothetical protein AEK19_MT1435 [Utricularia reniformis]
MLHRVALFILFFVRHLFDRSLQFILSFTFKFSAGNLEFNLRLITESISTQIFT